MRREVRLGARGGRADALVRARLHPGRVRGRPTSSSRWPRRRPRSARRSCRTSATRAPACSTRSAEMIDVAAPLGRAAPPLAPEVARGEQLIEPLLDADRRGERELDVTFDQYPYGAGRDAAREPAARRGRRRAAPRRRSRAPATAAPARGSRATSRAGSPAGRTCSARSARSGSSSAGRTLAELADGRTAVDDRLRPARSRRTLAAPMVLHYATDEAVRDGRRAPPAARRLRRHLRRPPAPAPLRHRAAVPRPLRRSARGCSRSRRRSRA